jgi:hypothetical protein
VVRGGSVDAGDLELVPGGGGSASISGRVTLGGQPAAGLLVTLSGARGGAVQTDPAGAYRFLELPPGRFTVTAAALSASPQTASAVLDVADGAQLSAPDLAFQPLGTLHGRVTLAGAATGNAGVFVYASGTAASALSDDSGGYRLEGVPVAQTVVRATRLGYRPGEAPAQVVYATDTAVPEIDLTVDPGGGTSSVSGVATRVGQTSHAGTRVSLPGSGAPDAVTAADGSFTLQSVVGGTYPLDLDGGPFQEHVPGLSVLAGGSAYFAASGLYPLSPIEVPRATRVVSSSAIVSWQAAGGTIAYLEGPYWGPTVLRVVPSGGAAQTVESAAGQIGYLLSPDGTQLAYFVPMNDPVLAGVIKVRSLADGTTHIVDLVHVVNTKTYSPIAGWQFSDDSAYLVYNKEFSYAYAAYFGTLAVYTIATHTAHDVAPHVWVFELSGSRVAYVADTMSGRTVAVSPLAGGAAIASVPGQWYSLIGDHLFVTQAGSPNFTGGDYPQGPLSVTQLATRQTTQLSAADVRRVVLSPDGSRVYIMILNADGSITLQAVPSTGGAAVTLADGLNGGQFSRSSYLLSPDGQSIATYVNTPSPGTLEVLPATGGAPRVATSASVIGWTADSTRLVVTRLVAGKIALSLLAADGSSEAVVAPDVQSPLLSPDQQVVAYLGSARSSLAILRIPAPGMPPSPITVPVTATSFGFSPGSSTLWMRAQLDDGAPVTTLVDLAGNLTPVLRNAGDLTWLGERRVALRRSATPPPFAFQDGLYLSAP